jgi:hypothetical protein
LLSLSGRRAVRRSTAVWLLHSLLQVSIRRFDDQVVVVIQTIAELIDNTPGLIPLPPVPTIAGFETAVTRQENQTNDLTRVFGQGQRSRWFRI